MSRSVPKINFDFLVAEPTPAPKLSPNVLTALEATDMTDSPATEFARPFPALTPSQRLHLDIYGYVVIENAIDDDLTARLLAKAFELEDDFRRTGKIIHPSCFMTGESREFFRVDNLPHVDPCFLEYVADPYLVALAEEAVGAEVRLEQSDIHIRRPLPDGHEGRYGFHRGAGTRLCYQQGGLFNCQFVKTLTNLTDLGPDDGGTTVIAGTHKMTDVSHDALISAVAEDPSLIHHVVAPAGSTLLFFEALMHSAGIIKTGKDRVLIIGGYTPTNFAPWVGYDPDPAFVAQLPEHLVPLITGSKRFQTGSRIRPLDAPAEAKPVRETSSV